MLSSYFVNKTPVDLNKPLSWSLRCLSRYEYLLTIIILAIKCSKTAGNHSPVNFPAHTVCSYSWSASGAITPPTHWLLFPSLYCRWRQCSVLLGSFQSLVSLQCFRNSCRPAWRCSLSSLSPNIFCKLVSNHFCTPYFWWRVGFKCWQSLSVSILFIYITKNT